MATITSNKTGEAIALTPRIAFANPVHVLAFGLGSGLAPFAPGTFGTLVGVPLYILLQPLPLWAYALVVLALLLAGVWICGRAAQALNTHDHPGIVWDEIVGYLITLFAVPWGLWWMLAGFALFRLFDIVKPWPCGLIDRRVPGGLGIMLDDVVAGLYALGGLQLARLLLS